MTRKKGLASLSSLLYSSLPPVKSKDAKKRWEKASPPPPRFCPRFWKGSRQREAGTTTAPALSLHSSPYFPAFFRERVGGGRSQANTERRRGREPFSTLPTTTSTTQRPFPCFLSSSEIGLLHCHVPPSNEAPFLMRRRSEGTTPRGPKRRRQRRRQTLSKSDAYTTHRPTGENFRLATGMARRKRYCGRI